MWKILYRPGLFCLLCVWFGFLWQLQSLVLYLPMSRCYSKCMLLFAQWLQRPSFNIWSNHLQREQLQRSVLWLKVKSFWKYILILFWPFGANLLSILRSARSPSVNVTLFLEGVFLGCIRLITPHSAALNELKKENANALRLPCPICVLNLNIFAFYICILSTKTMQIWIMMAK